MSESTSSDESDSETSDDSSTLLSRYEDVLRCFDTAIEMLQNTLKRAAYQPDRATLLDPKSFLQHERSLLICWGCDIRIETGSLATIQDSILSFVIRSTFDNIILLLEQTTFTTSQSQLDLNSAICSLKPFVNTIRMSQALEKGEGPYDAMVGHVTAIKTRSQRQQETAVIPQERSAKIGTTVCKTCHNMLYCHKDRIGEGLQLQLSFRHHVKVEDVRGSAEADCYLCCQIWYQLQRLGSDSFRGELVDDSGTCLTATLRSASGWPGVYCLDFKATNFEGTIAQFILESTDTVDLAASSTITTSKNPSISSSTASQEVLDQARSWVRECIEDHKECNPKKCDHEECQRAPSSPWHPTRLLDLQQMLASNGSSKGVKLVSFKDSERWKSQQPTIDRYMTLSHRWGKAKFIRLTHDTLIAFQDSVSLMDLPQTFQDAIKVSCELGVRWLWIDALCILQDDEQDWLFESARMHMVYAHSYCNISATAAMDSFEGLFRSRMPLNSRVKDVTLSTNDLDGTSQALVRCTIFDFSFWAENVDHAPVNKRSWVFQERILAPRVLHWCQDQIAFECCQAAKAECRPYGLPDYLINCGELVQGARLKRFDVETGKKLRLARLRSQQIDSSFWRLEDEKLYFYELWKHVVEAFTILEIAKERDRLISISGIARLMASKMRSNDISDQYIAGMWQNDLASQLLWYVNEGSGKNRQPFENTRPADYRAPSFSWASVETGRGVTFADSTNAAYSETSKTGLLVEVEVVRLIYKRTDDMFGLLTDGYLIIKGVLRKIELTDAWANERKEATLLNWEILPQSGDLVIACIIGSIACFITLLNMQASYAIWGFTQYLTLVICWVVFCSAASITSLTFRVFSLGQTATKRYIDKKGNRFYWNLVKDGKPGGKKFEAIYLDSPASEPSIFGPDGGVFCLPASIDDRRLICLLVQATDGEYGIRYKRVGLTTVETIYQEVEDIKSLLDYRDIALGKYFWATGEKPGERGTICIV